MSSSLGDSFNFIGGNDLQTVELRTRPGGQDPVIIVRQRSPDETKKWLEEETAKDSHVLRVIFTDSQVRTKRQFFPLPLLRDDFEESFKRMDLPILWLRMLGRNAACSTVMAPTEKSKGFFMQTRPGGATRFSIAASYRKDKPLSFAFVHGTMNTDAVLHSLQMSGSTSWPLAIIPLYLIEKKNEKNVGKLGTVLSAMHANERKIGIDPKAILRPAQQPRPERPETWLSSIEFEDVTEDLTSVSSEIAKMQLNCEISMKMLDLVTEQVEQQRSPANLTFGDTVTMIEDLKCYIHSISQQAKYYSRRAEAQRQTLYSLIAQKDNLLNIQATRASLEVAKASRADSAAMSLIAWSNAKDSANMVAISAVTLFFLPATFVATFFSTDFFDFHNRASAIAVSKWIWVYFVITASLTAGVNAIWYIFSKRKARSIEKALELGGNDEMPMSLLLDGNFKSSCLSEKKSSFCKTKSEAQQQFAEDIERGSISNVTRRR